MSGRTWLMMFIVLTVIWGGFAVLLYLTIREKTRPKDPPEKD